MPSPLENAASTAVAAARASLRAAGFPEPEVIVTFAWSDGGADYVAASAVPRRLRDLLAQSLEASAEEALET